MRLESSRASTRSTGLCLIDCVVTQCVSTHGEETVWIPDGQQYAGEREASFVARLLRWSGDSMVAHGASGEFRLTKLVLCCLPGNDHGWATD